MFPIMRLIGQYSCGSTLLQAQTACTDSSSHD